MPPTVDERLMRTETLLEGFRDELKKGDGSFGQIKQELADVKARLVEQEKQVAFWKGALAFITFVWPLVVRYLMQ